MKAPDLAQRDRWNNRLKAIALGIGLALTLLTLRHWYETFSFGHPLCADCRADFPGFYAGAKLIWQSPRALYDYAQQLAIQRTIDNRIGDSVLPFAYPPFTALVLMPLGWLSFRAAFVAITLVNVLLLATALRLLIHKLELGKEQTTWLWLSAFCNFGVHTTLLQGQTSLTVLALLTAFMFALRGGRNRWAGFWAGVVFFKPQILAMPLIALFFQRRWRALLIAVIVVVGLGGFSVALVGAEGISEYLSLLRIYSTTESGFGSYPRDMHNLRALVQYFAPFTYATYFWLALVVLLAMATMWLNAQAYENDIPRTFLWIGNFLAAMQLTPHLYTHDLAFLLVPNALVLHLCGKQVPVPLILCLIILGVLPILPGAFGYFPPPVLPLLFLAGFYYCLRSVQRANSPA